MTRAGVVQKAPDTFLRGAYWTPLCLRGAFWTPPTDRHDTAMTRNDKHVFLDKKKTCHPFWPTRHGNDTKWHAFLEANVGKSKKNAHTTSLLVSVSSGPLLIFKGCLMDTRAKGCLLDTRLDILGIKCNFLVDAKERAQAGDLLLLSLPRDPRGGDYFQTRTRHSRAQLAC